MTEQVNTVQVSPLFLDDDSIYTKIIKDLMNGVFVAGDRLVTTKLSERYNTSVNPVREALKQLQGEGFVSVSPNSGARVTTFEYKDIRDVFEILQLLEPYLLEWFVQEHTSEHKKALYSLLDKMENISEGDHDTYRNLDTQFHWLLYSQHYNKSAIELWRHKRLVLQIMHANTPLSQSRTKQSLSEHKAIVAAIENCDVETALTVLKTHISGSGKYWSRHNQD